MTRSGSGWPLVYKWSVMSSSDSVAATSSRLSPATARSRKMSRTASAIS